MRLSMTIVVIEAIKVRSGRYAYRVPIADALEVSLSNTSGVRAA